VYNTLTDVAPFIVKATTTVVWTYVFLPGNIQILLNGLQRKPQHYIRTAHWPWLLEVE
jgi:hypothetical protein